MRINMKTAYMNSSDFNRIMAAVKGFERRGINDMGDILY